MSPAQRRKKLAQLKNKNRTKTVRKPYWLFVFVPFILLVVISFLTARFKALDRLALVVNGKGGEVIVQNFDFSQKEIVNVVIPGQTQLDVANQFGFYRAGNVWKLGLNEKKEGELLRLSVVKNFNLPIVAWADSGGEALGKGGLLGLIKAVILPYKSNLRFGDKLRLAVFSAGVREDKRVEVDLSKTALLREVRLTDGEMGYVVSGGGLPVSLGGIFSEAIGKSEPFRAMVKDNTGRLGVAEKAGGVLEVMGVKIASLTKGPTTDADCVVSGKDKRLVEKISLIFTCQVEGKLTDDNFDLILELGSKFAKRY